MKYTYEIFLKHGNISKPEWDEFLLRLADFLGSFSHWEVTISREQNILHYYLASPKPLPLSLNLAAFLLKPCTNNKLPDPSPYKSHGLYTNKWSDNFISILQDFHKHSSRLDFAVLTFRNVKQLISSHTELYLRSNGQLFAERLLLSSPSTFLSINFDLAKTFLYKKFPKYLKLEKVTKILSDRSSHSLLEIDPFPYLDRVEYLHHDQFDFQKHSLVIGGSGSGKSRFLASLIDKIHRANPHDYKIIVIDPHDTLYRDCTQISSRSVVNFQDLARSVDLFQCRAEDIHAGVELMLTLFRSLMNDSYNGRLERVLRYASYLLITARQFSFLTLRKLLLDLEYRNELLAQYQSVVPPSVAHFFLTDFNELKSQNYNDAIAPIVAFIDEMQMVPVFSTDATLTPIAEKIQNNFLNIFSLNRLRLGDKVVQTIAGLLMQQLFLFAEQDHSEHLIIIIDEVSVVENPIIARFLSELRKYHASIILAGQYFDQISPDLRAAVFANVSNYYLFRTSRSDAEILTQHLSIKVENSDDCEAGLKLLTGLKSRECLVQVSAADELLPIFKARTSDFSAPAIIENSPKLANNIIAKDDLLTQPFDFSNLQKFLSPETSSKTTAKPILKNKQIFIQEQSPPKAFNFEVNSDISFDNIKNNYSTSRKKEKNS